MTLFVDLAFTAPHCATLPGDSLIHAATIEAIIHAGFADDCTHETVEGACGADGLKLINLGNDQPVPWPPRIAGLWPGVRCRPCWIATGRKRPRSHHLRPVSA